MDDVVVQKKMRKGLHQHESRTISHAVCFLETKNYITFRPKLNFNGKYKEC